MSCVTRESSIKSSIVKKLFLLQDQAGNHYKRIITRLSYQIVGISKRHFSQICIKNIHDSLQL